MLYNEVLVSSVQQSESILYIYIYTHIGASLLAPVVKNPPAKAEDVRDVSSIPGLRSSPGGGHGNPLQYSCLENSMDRGAWWAIVRGVTKSQTRLKQLIAYIHIYRYIYVCIHCLYAIYTDIFFFKFFSIVFSFHSLLMYYKILSRVLCAIQWVLLFIHFI